jgi:hypothetical protein
VTNVRRTSIPLLALATLALAAPFPIHATPEGPCSDVGPDAVGILPIPPSDPQFYVDERGELEGNGVWLYEETNNDGHLERGGSALVPGINEICTDPAAWPPDLLIV